MESAKVYPLKGNRLEHSPLLSAPTTVPRPKLLDQVRQAIRTRHYSHRTEKAYVHWIKRFVFFHNKRHPIELGEPEIAQFLSSLASDSHVSASTQNQALNALLFLYKEVLEKKIWLIQGVVRANRPKRLPVVLTIEEVKRVLDCLQGTPWLMAVLLYGAGLRLLECCHLRIKDIDFARNQIVVRAGKGNKDRYTMLPAAVVEPLRKHLQVVKRQHEEDLTRGLGRVALPDALERKYPNAGKEWGWQWVFPATSHYVDKLTEKIAGIIFTKRFFRKRSKKQGSRQTSSSRRVVTPYVILSQPICWRTATISERFRSCSATTTSVLR
jgi:integron integrase